MIPEWLQQLLPIAICGAVGYCMGMLRHVDTKLDKLQKQVEHLHTQLYNSGAFDRRQR